MNSIKYSSLLIMAILLTFAYSCKDEDECQICNNQPEVADHEFNLLENSPKNTVVDTVYAFDADSDQSISYNIKAGNEGNAFSIGNSDGVLRVADSTQIDYEKVDRFLLVIEVKDSKGLSDIGLVTINILDVPEIPIDGLMAYYPLDGHANDHSQNNHHGVVFGALPTTDRKGNANGAFQFDGYEDHISFSGDFAGFDSTFSISLWVKTSNLYDQWIIGKYDGPGDAGFHLSTYEGNPRFNGRDGNEIYIRCIASNSIANNHWHHLVAVLDNSLWSLWIDNEVAVYTNSMHQVVNIHCSIPLELGRHYLGDYGDHKYFSGCIDDVRVYDNVLTLEDISNLFSE